MIAEGFAPHLTGEFAARAEGAGMRVVRASAGALPAAIEPLLPPGASVGVGRELVAQYPGLQGLEHGDDRWPRIAITGGEFGIAFTGSAVVAPVEHTDRLLAILSRLHIVAMPAGAVVADLAQAARVMQGWLQPARRRYVTFVTGPSRTSDIERVLTVGVHGPAEVVLVLVEGGASGGA